MNLDYTLQNSSPLPLHHAVRPMGRCLSKLAVRIVCASAMLLAAAQAAAQAVPYGQTDKARLSEALNEAKSHMSDSASDLKWLKVAAIASHQLATLKVDSAAEEAVRLLTQVCAAAPADYEMMAYLGSAHAMLGRDSSFVVSKVKHVNKAIATLDVAVKNDPRNLTVRLIRAGVSITLPAMFERKRVAEEDYRFVAAQAEAGASVHPLRLAEVYYQLGQFASEAKQSERAQQYYAQAQRVAPQSGWAEKAAKAQK